MMKNVIGFTVSLIAVVAGIVLSVPMLVNSSNQNIDCPKSTSDWWALIEEVLNHEPSRDTIVRWDNHNRESIEGYGLIPKLGWTIWCYNASDIQSSYHSMLETDDIPFYIGIPEFPGCEAAGFIVDLPDRQIVGVTSYATGLFADCMDWRELVPPASTIELRFD